MEHELGALLSVRSRDPSVLQRQHYVFERSDVAEQMKALKNEAQVGQASLRLLGSVELRHVLPGEMVGAAGGAIEAPDNVQQRRFSAPRRSAQGHDFAGVDVEVEVVEDGDRGFALAVDLRQVADLDERITDEGIADQRIGHGRALGSHSADSSTVSSCRKSTVKKRLSSLRRGWTPRPDRSKQSGMVPAVAHFIWFGRTFWWVNALAIRSCCQRGEFERVVLHHDEDLAEIPAFAELSTLPNFEARRLEPDAVLRRTGKLGPALIQLYGALEKPNARANVIRAAILALEGGVYLDTDTVTVRSLAPLRTSAAFCGQERVVFPVREIRDRRLKRFVRSGALMAAREVCRLLPDGWRRFRKVEDRFPLAVNNAVLGATAGHPFVWALLEAMVALPVDRRRVPYALGTHLLQDQVAAYGSDDLMVHPPSVFFPLGPEISHHWFRIRGDRWRAPPLDEVIQPDTRVVHWYASVRTRNIVPYIDPDYVRSNADRQLFSALARPFVEGGGPA